ncbi:MAG: hypothetical protein RLZZ157_740 [Pseudomonadota bacterium]|jgi:Fe-S cluster assembly protein SufD
MGRMVPILNAGEAALLAALPDTPAGEAARALLAAQGLPTRRDEAFKWSDLRAALAQGLPEEDGSAGMVPLCFQDGLVVDFAPEGFGIEGQKGAGLTIESEESVAIDTTDPLATLAAGLAPRTVVMRVTQSQSAPIFLRRHPGAPMRVHLHLGPEVQMTLIDTALASAGLSTAYLEIELAAGAYLTRISLQDSGARGLDLAHTQVLVGEGGHYQAVALALGGAFARAQSVVQLLGQDALCDLDGAYVLSGQRHADATTLIAHKETGGRTRETFKGVVKDQARGVFQGKIAVARAAQQTDARQNHHALMLSEGAQISAKPELEIYADDVQCAHGNTIGALDDAALFYMRQRGLPEPDAKALLIAAFVQEVFDQVTDEAARDWLLSHVTAWMAEAAL